MRLFNRLLKRTIRISYHLWFQATGRGHECGLKTNLNSAQVEHSSIPRSIKTQESQNSLEAQSCDDLTFKVYSSMFPDDPRLLRVNEDRVRLISQFLFERCEDQDVTGISKTRYGKTNLTSEYQDELKVSAARWKLEAEREPYSAN